MADETIYGCYDRDERRWYFEQNSCCRYAGCFVRTGAHQGKVKVTHPGTCSGDYYACFNSSTHKWELVLPDSCCEGTVWKIKDMDVKPYIEWIYDTVARANGLVVESGNVYVCTHAAAGNSYRSLYELTQSGLFTRAYSRGGGSSGPDGYSIWRNGTNVYVGHTYASNAFAFKVNSTFTHQQDYKQGGSSPTCNGIYADGTNVYFAPSASWWVLKASDADVYQCHDATNTFALDVFFYNNKLYMTGGRYSLGGTWYSVFEINMSTCAVTGKVDTGLPAAKIYADGDGFYVAGQRNNASGSYESVWYYNTSWVKQWGYDTGDDANAVWRSGDYVYVCGLRNNASGDYESVWKLNKSDGSKEWGFDTCLNANDIAESGGSLYVATIA